MTKWVKALRSGRYKQGKRRLKQDDRYCCLGVLCNISKVSKWNKSGSYGRKGDREQSALPECVAEWAGMKTQWGIYPGSDQMIGLANLNDTQNYTFEQIADIIEKNYKDL